MADRSTARRRRAARRASRAARRSPARARYAYEHHVEGVAYAVARAGHDRPRRGHARSTPPRRSALPGVLAVLCARRTRRGWPTPTTRELARAPVAATSPTAARSSPSWSPRRLEAAREAAGARARRVRRASRTTSCCAPTIPSLYAPEKVNPDFPTRHRRGRRRRRRWPAAAVAVDATYTTPAEHNNPMEPHATLARVGAAATLTLYDSTQGAPARARHARAGRSGSTAEQVRVISPHVGGGFGSKGIAAPARRRSPRWPPRRVGPAGEARVTRQQMFAARRLPHADDPAAPARRRRRRPADGDRARRRRADLDARASSPSRPRVADADDVRGAEPPHRRTGSPRSTCRRRRGCARRASARACSRSSRRWTSWRVALRHRPDRAADPQRARRRPRDRACRSSSRNLVACLREGAERFGWAERDPRAGRRGATGAGWSAPAWPSSTYPALPARRRRRRARADADGALRRRASAPPTSAPAPARC